MTKKKKTIDYYGKVMGPQVLMVMTFDDKQAEYLAESLGGAIERAYQVFNFFDHSDEEEDPFE